jgi:hypothetical protein
MSSAIPTSSANPVKGMRKNGKILSPSSLTLLHCSVKGFQLFYYLPRAAPADRLSVSTGKNWRDSKKPFRPTSGLTSYEKRLEARKRQEAVKEHERELREEKEAERKVGRRRKALHGLSPLLTILVRPKYRRSRIGELPRKKKNATRKWQRKCIANELSG